MVDLFARSWTALRTVVAELAGTAFPASLSDKDALLLGI
jgi:hypothetical protein